LNGNIHVIIGKTPALNSESCIMSHANEVFEFGN
jgi:hypothetical protein